MPPKKTFKDNPALNFISSPTPPSSRPRRTKVALEVVPATKAAGAAVAASPDTRLGETKSQRVQLLMRPGLHQRLTEAARNQGRSLNDLIHTVLDDWADRA